MTPEEQRQMAEQSAERKNEDQQNDEQVVIPIHAEEVSVDKKRIVTGRVKVATVTKEHEQLVEEMLERNHVEIERTAVGKEVEKTPPVREEGDTLVIPIMEEVVVVERRLFLKEELRIHRISETQPYQQRVVVRKQEAVITRLPDDETNKSAAA